MEKQINLGLENFWNPLKEKYPNAVEKFCVWIDEYKKRVGWDYLFAEGYMARDGFIRQAPKFHNIPIEMQMGIILAFMGEVGYLKEAGITPEILFENVLEGVTESFSQLETKFQS